MDIRFKQPFWKWMVKLSVHLPEPLKEKFLDWLYPDDAVIHFKGD